MNDKKNETIRELSYEELQEVVGGAVIAGTVCSRAVTATFMDPRLPTIGGRNR